MYSLNQNQNQNLIFSAEDIRQYVYCPMKIYYRYVLRNKMLITPKMRRGEKLHKELCKDRVKNPDDEAVKYYYNVYLIDERLGLSAMIDVIEMIDNTSCKVIDLKSSKPPEVGVHDGEKMQVAAQALLVETNLNLKVRSGAIYYIRRHEQIDFEITSIDLLNVLRILDRIRRIVATEEIPRGTSNLAHCNDCECRRYCWWD